MKLPPSGGASGATGLFYCPLDEKVYLDTAIFTTLRQRRGASSEAMSDAKQISDGTLPRNACQVPQPHTFSQGTSARRQAWFARGYETRDIKTCGTFSFCQLAFIQQLRVH